MSNDQIEKFLQQIYLDKAPVKVTFKTRKPLVGIFIKTADYSELKSKNFWRIVGESNVSSYLKSKDANLARIFNGAEITKLSAP
jgi:protoheme ferro-lyase